MKRWFRYLGVLLGIVATVAFVFYAIHVLKGQDFSRYVSISAITGIAMAALCYSFIIPMSALAWRSLLRDMGTVRTWSELTVIMAVSQFAKYIPGNVGQHVGRAAMSLGRGIPPRPYGVSVVSEMVLAVLAAAVTGLAGCGLAGVGVSEWQKHSNAVVPFIAFLACGFILAVTVGRRLVRWLVCRLSPGVYDGGRVALPGNSALVLAFVTYLLNYALFGAGITMMVLLLLPGQDASWLLLTGSFALAWVIGFFTPGAPAGLGVREGLLLALLQLPYSQPDALLIVIALRLATTLGDVLCFILGIISFYISGKRTEPGNTFNQPPCDHHET